ncbi:MAG: hypothetical protein H6621_10140 [Halobacteriovoraceae bacterium]|nr:hypothetical protein [Halobacteriovoraceae bacterium]MCB9095416.1 hypothetical protein [Halobacteriovoraceae bacterium]
MKLIIISLLFLTSSVGRGKEKFELLDSCNVLLLDREWRADSLRRRNQGMPYDIPETKKLRVGIYDFYENLSDEDFYRELKTWFDDKIEKKGYPPGWRDAEGDSGEAVNTLNGFVLDHLILLNKGGEHFKGSALSQAIGNVSSGEMLLFGLSENNLSIEKRDNILQKWERAVREEFMLRELFNRLNVRPNNFLD